MCYTTDLADFAARTKFKDLPDSVVEMLKIVFFDTLMCGVAAQDFERTRMMHSIREAEWSCRVHGFRDEETRICD